VFLIKGKERYVDAVTCILKSVEKIRERLGVTHDEGREGDGHPIV